MEFGTYVRYGIIYSYKKGLVLSMTNNNQKSGGGSTFLTVIIVILVIAGIGSCSGYGDSEKTATCQVCHKTFTNSDDRNSIAWRNMCENCYSNYKYTQDLKDELKKYEERYGN